MKININSHSGFLAQKSSENEIKIEGVDAKEYPFDDRWDDLYAFIDEGTGPAALSYEGYRDTGVFFRFFRHNQNDTIFMKYQMPHSWDPTTGIRPHAHVIPMASGSGDAKFNFIYSWSNVGDVLPGAVGWITGSLTASFTPADQYKHKVISRGVIMPPSGAHESALFLLRIERDGGDAADTYTTNKDHGTTAANIGILFLDLHYQKNKAGTITEFPEIPSS